MQPGSGIPAFFRPSALEGCVSGSTEHTISFGLGLTLMLLIRVILSKSEIDYIAQFLSKPIQVQELVAALQRVAAVV